MPSIVSTRPAKPGSSSRMSSSNAISVLGFELGARKAKVGRKMDMTWTEPQQLLSAPSAHIASNYALPTATRPVAHGDAEDRVEIAPEADWPDQHDWFGAASAHGQRAKQTCTRHGNGC